MTLQTLRARFHATAHALNGPCPGKPGEADGFGSPELCTLLRSWAQCEGRELTSVVLQCVELSVRQLKSNGSIPASAVTSYERACEERLAAANAAP